VYRIAGISEDITERRQVNEALRQSKFDLAEAQRAARMAGWTYDIAAIRSGGPRALSIFDVDKVAFGGAYEISLPEFTPMTGLVSCSERRRQSERKSFRGGVPDQDAE